MEKVIRDGKVAVLVSPGFGAGFFSWGAPVEAIFDPILVKLIEDDCLQEAVSYVEETYEDVYSGGVADLEIVWMDENTEFTITDYDGFENIQYKSAIEWITS